MRRKIRKFAENKQSRRQAENSKPEATLIPCGSWGRAGQYLIFSCGIAVPNNNGDITICVMMNGIYSQLRDEANFRCFQAIMNASDRAEVDTIQCYLYI